MKNGRTEDKGRDTQVNKPQRKAAESEAGGDTLLSVFKGCSSHFYQTPYHKQRSQQHYLNPSGSQISEIYKVLALLIYIYLY